MSVAFRREGDEEHREPKFEIPLPPGPNLVTARGLALIEARIVELESALPGAESEAAEGLRRDLRYWHTRRTTAQPSGAPPDGTAGFATRVTLRQAGNTRVIEIVGDDEANPALGRIGWSAPLARAVRGSEPGECVAFDGRADAIELLSVSALES